MEYLLRRTTHLLVVATWLGGAYLIGLWSPPAGVAFLAIGVALFVRALRRGAFHLERPSGRDEAPVNTEREARLMVTQVLRNLTLIQVAYLCQDFRDRRQSRAWLKKALPRSFRSNLDEVHSTLENARMGAEPPGLRLALRIHRLRQSILDMEDALEKSAPSFPDHELAHPVVFVITEHLGGEENLEPEVVTLAGWNPSRATLIPGVQRLALLTEVEGKKQARGHAALGDLRRCLGEAVEEVVPEQEGGPLYAVGRVEDPAARGVEVQRVPLGFVVGVAEML